MTRHAPMCTHCGRIGHSARSCPLRRETEWRADLAEINREISANGIETSNRRPTEKPSEENADG